MKTPHKHADIIKAWADGAEIEFSFNGYEWRPIAERGWRDDVGYRIKPEPKPDVVGYAKIISFWSSYQSSDHNLKLTFDGETGNLKAAEVIE